jgi:hypothetical protein
MRLISKFFYTVSRNMNLLEQLLKKLVNCLHFKKLSFIFTSRKLIVSYQFLSTNQSGEVERLTFFPFKKFDKVKKYTFCTFIFKLKFHSSPCQFFIHPIINCFQLIITNC